MRKAKRKKIDPTIAPIGTIISYNNWENPYFGIITKHDTENHRTSVLWFPQFSIINHLNQGFSHDIKGYWYEC